MFRIYPIYQAVLMIILCDVSLMAADPHLSYMMAFNLTECYDGSWVADIDADRQLFYNAAGSLHKAAALISILENSLESIACKDSGRLRKGPKQLILTFESDKPGKLIGGFLKESDVINQFTQEEIDLLCDAAEQSDIITGIWINKFDLNRKMFERFARLKLALIHRDFQISLGNGLKDDYNDVLQAKFEELVASTKLPPPKISAAPIETSQNTRVILTNSPNSVQSLPGPTLTDEIIKKFNLRKEFPHAINMAAAKIGFPKQWGDREDLTNMPLITIDGKDAKDFDDAVFAEPDLNPNNPGGYRIIVAIADVSYFVKSYDELDLEAYRRGNSVYFPDRVLPMLPEVLSNQWCSLIPNEHRLVLAVEMFINKEGSEAKLPRFFRGVMKSVARLTYEQVQSAHGNKEISIVLQAINHLYGAFDILKSARSRRGTLELNMPTKKIEFMADEDIPRVSTEPHYDSHRLIEELMVLANHAAANFLENSGIPFLYRVHCKPEQKKLDDLKEWFKGKCPNQEELAILNQKTITKILGTLFDYNSEYVDEAKEKVLFAQSRAAYSSKKEQHYGLNLAKYCHFTSPIRRYADLLIHRAIISVLENNPGLYPYDNDVLDEIGNTITDRERNTDKAVRELMEQIMKLF